MKTLDNPMLRAIDDVEMRALSGGGFPCISITCGWVGVVLSQAAQAVADAFANAPASSYAYGKCGM